MQKEVGGMSVVMNEDGKYMGEIYRFLVQLEYNKVRGLVPRGIHIDTLGL